MAKEQDDISSIRNLSTAPSVIAMAKKQTNLYLNHGLVGDASVLTATQPPQPDRQAIADYLAQIYARKEYQAPSPGLCLPKHVQKAIIRNKWFYNPVTNRRELAVRCPPNTEKERVRKREQTRKKRKNMRMMQVMNDPIKQPRLNLLFDSSGVTVAENEANTPAQYMGKTLLDRDNIDIIAVNDLYLSIDNGLDLSTDHGLVGDPSILADVLGEKGVSMTSTGLPLYVKVARTGPHKPDRQAIADHLLNSAIDGMSTVELNIDWIRKWTRESPNDHVHAEGITVATLVPVHISLTALDRLGTKSRNWKSSVLCRTDDGHYFKLFDAIKEASARCVKLLIVQPIQQPLGRDPSPQPFAELAKGRDELVPDKERNERDELANVLNRERKERDELAIVLDRERKERDELSQERDELANVLDRERRERAADRDELEVEQRNFKKVKHEHCEGHNATVAKMVQETKELLALFPRPRDIPTMNGTKMQTRSVGAQKIYDHVTRYHKGKETIDQGWTELVELERNGDVNSKLCRDTEMSEIPEDDPRNIGGQIGVFAARQIQEGDCILLPAS